MSDYRTPGDRGRARNEDERSGRMGERDARRRAFYGERDAYGEWDREAYGRTGSESGYGRDKSDSGRYASRDTRGYGPSFSSGAFDDRFGRGDLRDTRGSYGGDRYGRRSEYGAGGSSYDDYGARDRSRQASGYDQGERNFGDERYRGEERGFVERAGDEIASWFGDRDAERRRETDRQFGGRGPKGYTRSDERIRDDVNDRLTDDHYIDASDVEVGVKDREVTLSGHVPTRDQKRRAEDLAERVSGVTHVQNNLRVQSGTGSYAGTGATDTTGVGSAAGEIGGSRSWGTDTTGRTTS